MSASSSSSTTRRGRRSSSRSTNNGSSPSAGGQGSNITLVLPAAGPSSSSSFAHVLSTTIRKRPGPKSKTTNTKYTKYIENNNVKVNGNKQNITSSTTTKTRNKNHVGMNKVYGDEMEIEDEEDMDESNKSLSSSDLVKVVVGTDRMSSSSTTSSSSSSSGSSSGSSSSSSSSSSMSMSMSSPSPEPELQQQEEEEEEEQQSRRSTESAKEGSGQVTGEELSSSCDPVPAPFVVHYACPKCFRAFLTMNILREHVANYHHQDESNDYGPCALEVGHKGMILEMGPTMSERHLSVLRSRIHGRGLFTGNFIPKGEMIIEYTGEAMSRVAALRRQHFYDVNRMENYIMRIGKTMIDATVNGNCSRFINNSCDPNCETEILDLRGVTRVLILASRDIRGGEELTYDYKFTSDELVPCNCGSKKCKRFINSNLGGLKLRSEAEIQSLIQALQ